MRLAVILVVVLSSLNADISKPASVAVMLTPYVGSLYSGQTGGILGAPAPRERK